MTTQNLRSEDAVAKIRQIAASIDYTMMCTDLSSKPFHAIPMSTKRVDDAGRLWFLSGSDSTHNQNIRHAADVQLLYADPGSAQFLTVFGQATIHTDRSTLADLYDSSDDAWFDGVDDPRLTAICVRPVDAHYWDTKHNRLVTLIKIGAAAVTGSQADVGVQGDLNV